MSFTTTAVQRSETYTHGTIHLTPSKRWRSNTEAELRKPTTAELWSWTLTHDAIAECFVRDVFNMKEHGETGKEADFFWLGRVPCRTVRIVGLVVGVKTYEKRIVYTVDDGTSVIDCTHRSPPEKKPPKNALPDSLKPLAYVGNSVCVVGKVVGVLYLTASTNLEVHVVRCASSNDEPNHWMKVMSLHKSSYSLPGPFVIPPTSHQPTSPAKSVLDNASPAKEPPTPSTVCSTPASVLSSPAKSISSQSSPKKLRHPSRLHSRDLTGNTFQLYMKHFMVHAPYTDPSREPDYDSDSDIAGDLPSTPTKRLRRSSAGETPRTSFSYPADNTPRPKIPKLLLKPQQLPKFSEPPTSSSTDPTSTMQGFTLSYLRRVPELADMARRVVKVEAKRRLREERKKAKGVATSSAHGHAKSQTTISQDLDMEQIAPKVKRLFKWSIVRLLQDGSIVLWDGPVRACRQIPGSHTSGLWKANVTSDSTVGADSTIFTAISQCISLTNNADDDDEGMELSDPEPNEEAYVPLSPSYLAEHVARAIGALTHVELKKNTNSPRRPAQSTKEGILAYLRKDDRWQFVGEWNVEEALEVLKSERRAWCIDKRRWELTV